MADTLNPDNLRANIERAIANNLNSALSELPRLRPWRHHLAYRNRRRAAKALTLAAWPYIMDAALGIAQACINDPGTPVADAPLPEQAPGEGH